MSQIRAFERVDFSIAGISQVRLAGVDLSGVRQFTQLTFVDAGYVAAGFRDGNLPLTFEVQVAGDNPSDNGDARLVRMEWTLFLEDRETVSGLVAEEHFFPSGQSTTFPLVVQLNLFDFFEGSARDLFELALSFTGMGGESKTLMLQALPVVETAFGPLVYREPIRIEARDIGQ